MKGKATEVEIWALGRLGARAPFSGPLNCVVARDTVERMGRGAARRRVDRARRRPASRSSSWRAASATASATSTRRCARRLAERLRALPQGERAARLVTEVVPLEAQERARILDESLPVGLVLAADGDRATSAS